MRASRLVSILLLLQTRQRMTARELADALEVSVRTIYRDVDSLSAAGIPLYGEAGHDGGYQLLDGYRTRLTGLTAGEAESLFLTGLPTAAADLGLGATVTAAQLKLMAALPPELRDRAGRIAERFHLDAPSWYRDGEHTPHLGTIANAVWNQRPVRMRYMRWEKPHEVTRTVRPYGLVLKAGHWYVVAHGEQLRTYRVSRILDAELLPESFDRDDSFDLMAFWQSYLANFDSRRLTGQATVRLSPKAVEYLGINTDAEPDTRGWVEATIPIESVEQALSELLRLGAEAEILAPRQLRDKAIETLRAMIGRYQAT